MTTAQHSPPAGRAPLPGDHEFPGRDGDVLRVRGALLGFTTSERDAHSHDEYHRDEDDVAASLRWATRRHETLGELLGGRQLSRVDHDRAVLALETFEQLLRRDDVPPHRKPWYQIDHGRCSRCRWFEARVVRVDAELVTDSKDPALEHAEPPSGRYLVLTYGRTRVPGEADKRRATWTDSGFEVVELLVQRDRSEKPFLPAASARVLAQAAEHDDGIREAYVNRAVA